MKEIFETIGLLLPTILVIIILIIIINFYLLIKRYIYVKIEYYKLRIEEIKKKEDK